jgi:hypothetical protein
MRSTDTTKLDRKSGAKPRDLQCSQSRAKAFRRHVSNLRDDAVEDRYMFPGGHSAYAGLRDQYGCPG